MPEGYGLQAFDVLDSTNEEAKRQATAGATPPLWIMAREQSSGRGRRGREWVSERGNLFCSLLLKGEGDVVTSSQLSFVAALAVRDVVADLVQSDSRARCKWPNDVLLDGRKVSGILLESQAAAAKGSSVPEFVIIGIGVNLASHPQKALYPATSLNMAAGMNVTSEQALELLASSMAYWIGRWKGDGFSVIRTAWLDKAEGLGQNITVRLPQEEFTGRFIDLDVTGGVKVETDTGQRIITAGDVFFAPRSS